MEFKGFEIIANLIPRSIQNFHDLDSRRVKEILLDMGYENIVLEGVFIEEFSKGAFLFVEDDAEFLMEYYFYLEELVKKQNDYEHHAFLGDGLLTLEAKSAGEKVKLDFKYYPGVDMANLINHTVNISNNEYLWWWRSIAHKILNTVSQHDRPLS